MQRDARIQRVASASASLNPLDPEDKTAVSDYWDHVSEAYASDDAAAKQKAELAFVARVGVLPAALGRKYQGALLSDEASVAVLGAEAIDALAKIDPALLNDMPEERVRRAQAIAQYAALGLPPERAIELAEKNVNKSALEHSGRDDPTGPGRLFLAAAENDSGRGTGEQIAQAEGTQPQPPSWDEVLDLANRLEKEGEAAFAIEARKAGLDPERTRLLIDILKAMPVDRKAIVGRIRGLYGRMGALFLQEQLEKLIWSDDVEVRKKALDDRRQDLLASAREREERNEQAYDQVQGIFGVFGRGNGRSGAQGRKSEVPKPTSPLRPGPGYRANRTFITPNEFRKLPDKGKIDPQRVRTASRIDSKRKKSQDRVRYSAL